MKRVSTVLGAAGLLALWSACAGDDGPTGSGDCTLDGVDLFATLTPVLPPLFVRETVEVTPELLQGLGSDCTTEELEQLELTSDAPGIASVSSNVVTGVSPGIVRMRVGLLASADSFDLEVRATAATGVAVTPSSWLLAVDDTYRFVHACRDSDDFDTECPAAVTWSTDPASSSVASVDNTGLVTANAAGTVGIIATVGSLADTATLTVASDPNPATSVVVTPSNRQMGIGTTYQFQHVCRDASDNDTVCPGPATWRTNPVSSPVASVDGTGLVRANAEGSVDVTVTVGSLEGSATVTVTTSTPLFQMDLSPGAYPLAGFDAIADTLDNRYSIVRRPNAGPDGQPSYQLIVHDSSYAVNGGQPYVGWSVTLPSGAPFIYGGTVFVRFRFRWIANTRCESWEPPSTPHSTHRSKFHIINDNAPGGNGAGRAMIGIDCSANVGGDEAVDSMLFQISRANSDQRCYSNGTTNYEYTHAADTTWVDIQYEHAFSSSQGANDGTYAIWIDNDSYGSPTCRVSNIVINTDGAPSWFRWGFYWNRPPRGPVGNAGYELTDYEIGTSFDPNWNN